MISASNQGAASRRAFLQGGAVIAAAATTALVGRVEAQRTGHPSHEGIPHWPAYDATTRTTMDSNDDTRVENDPRGAMRRYWA